MILGCLRGGKSGVDCDERLKKLIISKASHVENPFAPTGRNQSGVVIRRTVNIPGKPAHAMG